MNFEQNKALSVSDFVNDVNFLMGETYIDIQIEGEVAEFKINQGKWVFFNLKDDMASLGCFMVLSHLRTPIADGMKIVVTGTPKVTNWGKFSFTVRSIKMVGAGDLKRSFELLKKKLADEGLFDVVRKRSLPSDLVKIGVISSTAAAGFADFVKILNSRWGGMEVLVAHTAVQGESAPDQMIRALEYLNQRTDVQLIAILRGGGSADDLSCFNDEKLVRAVAGSRVPVITGIGHEIDQSLTDLVADIVASTPSNLAEMISRDRVAEKRLVRQKVLNTGKILLDAIKSYKMSTKYEIGQIQRVFQVELRKIYDEMVKNWQILESYNPEGVLKRGYAIISGEKEADVGSVVKITTFDKIMQAEVKNVEKRAKIEG